MSKFRLTVNTQQLVDVLIISIAECARDPETITVEEIYKTIQHFVDRVEEHVDPEPERGPEILAVADDGELEE